MRILVNNEPLDFTLEHEQTLGEVIDGIAQWLNEGNYTVTDLEINGMALAIHDRDSWADQPVDQVEALKVDAVPQTEAEQVTLVALDHYLSLLVEATESVDELAIADIASELPFVRQRLIQFFPALQSADAVETILVDESLELGKLPNDPASVIETATILRTLLSSRLREYSSPDQELALTLGRLVSSESSLVQVPVQLQTGEIAIAMNTVGELAENLARVLRMLPLVTSQNLDTDGIRTFAEEVSPILSELEQAFEIQDTVLVGDLLEYEIAPRLSSLSQYVKEDAATS